MRGRAGNAPGGSTLATQIEKYRHSSPGRTLSNFDKLRQIGSATLRGTIDCPRCVMVTHPQDELAKDPGIMRAIVREAGGSIGVYANVEEPGEIAVGDPLEKL